MVMFKNLKLPRINPSSIGALANAEYYSLKPMPCKKAKHEIIKHKVVEYLSGMGFSCNDKVSVEIPVVTSRGDVILIKGEPDLLCKSTRGKRTLVVEVKSRSYITIGDIVQLSAYTLGIQVSEGVSNVEGAIAITNSNGTKVELIPIDIRGLILFYEKYFVRIAETIANKRYLLKADPNCENNVIT